MTQPVKLATNATAAARAETRRSFEARFEGRCMTTSAGCDEAGSSASDAENDACTAAIRHRLIKFLSPRRQGDVSRIGACPLTRFRHHKIKPAPLAGPVVRSRE